MTTIDNFNIRQQLDLSNFELVLPEDTKALVIYPTAADFPFPGKTGRIYHDQSSNIQWLWDEGLIAYRLMIETIDCGEF